ncbi:hypothetical protein AB0O34_27665 [Sphaerisporangium sp. NPDC088356]|uniref:hypothetical protein n=1 Tax=Sphaerisporangium sp. NPDC088356 TaxID=3154871 RepID=UPI0034470CB4
MLRARTLVEAYLYIDLTVAAGDDGDLPADFSAMRWATLSEGQEAWTLRFDGPDTGRRHLIEILVPYQTESEARRDRLRFGPGVSELIDAGQWLSISLAYAQRALNADLSYAEAPGDEESYTDVVLNWEFARDAAAEAAKFLPVGADEVPPEAFWTEPGAAVRAADPERFTRPRLEDDIAFYQQNIDDFTGMFGDR